VAGDFACRVPRHHYSLGTIGLAIELALSAPCSLRAGASVLEWLTPLVPGLPEAPCANTTRNWLFRLGLYELTCAKDPGDDWVWLVDHTVQLGVHKGLVVVGLRSSDWQQEPWPLGHQDVRLLHLKPMERSDGQRVCEELQRTAARYGVPRAIVSDGGSDLRRGVALFRGEHPQVTHSNDIKHKTALLLKKEMERDPAWAQYVSQANLARHGLTLTSASFLVPPGLKAKARYMNVDRLVRWGRDVLAYLDAPREVPGAAVDRKLVEDRLGWLRKCRRPLARWAALVGLAEVGDHYVRHHGYHAAAAEKLRGCLEPLASGPAGRRMRDALVAFVSQQSSAARPGERLVGSTEVLESIIGKYKRLQSMHSGGGMTGMILSVGALVGRRSPEAVRTALEQVTNHQVGQWCREHLGVTVQAQRKSALPPAQKWDPQQFVAT
jgi:hypothetical protein